MESILNSVKKALGIDPDYTAFDPELIIFINTELETLRQIGVGSVDGFTITDANDVWSDFISNEPKWSSVPTYIYIKVRLIFDPPQSSAAVEALTKTASELEWRLNSTAEYEPLT